MALEQIYDNDIFMMSFSALSTLDEEYPIGTVVYPWKVSIMQLFDAFCVLGLSKLLNKLYSCR